MAFTRWTYLDMAYERNLTTKHVFVGTVGTRMETAVKHVGTVGTVEIVREIKTSFFPLQFLRFPQFPRV